MRKGLAESQYDVFIKPFFIFIYHAEKKLKVSMIMP